MVLWIFPTSDRLRKRARASAAWRGSTPPRTRAIFLLHSNITSISHLKLPSRLWQGRSLTQYCYPCTCPRQGLDRGAHQRVRELRSPSVTLRRRRYRTEALSGGHRAAGNRSIDKAYVSARTPIHIKALQREALGEQANRAVGAEEERTRSVAFLRCTPLELR
jgi:hypothetical protein